ncbi:MAG: LysR family transcriptional regulator [Pseudorhodobacter sp.]
MTQLRSFVEVYRQGSVSKAAIELGLTQPAVSGHIASLEAQLERKLFTRHSRGVKPTIIADELAQRVSSAMETAENALAELRARSVRLTGTIHLCGPFDILSDLLVDRLRALADGGIALQLYPANGAEMIDMLAEGRADFAFAVIAPDDPRIDNAVYGQDEVLLVATPDLAGRIRNHGPLGAALTVVPHLAYDRDHYLIRRWLEHNRMTSDDMHDAVTIPDLRALRNFAEKGLGWSILPHYLVRAALASGSLAEIPAPHGNPTITYHLLWHKSAMRNPKSAKAKALLLEPAGRAET